MEQDKELEADWIHPGVQHEWWYANGHLGTERGRMSFMVSFLSNCLYVMLVDHKSKICHTRVITDSSLVFDDYGRRLQYGPSSWVLGRQSTSGPVHHIEIRTRGLAFRLDMQPKSRPLKVGRVPLGMLGSVNYYALLDLDCKGIIEIGEEKLKVSGTAWIDRMWGTWDSAGFNRWEWVSMTLNDGMSAVFFSVFHPIFPKNRLLIMFLWRSSPDKKFKYQQVEFKHLRTWTSGRTHTSYPLGWQIRSDSEPKIDLSIEPVVDDQELRPYIWEGACTVTGVLGGRPVHGEAFGEILYGLAQDRANLLTLALLVYGLLGSTLRKISPYIEQTLRKIVSRPGKRVSKLYWA